MNTPEFIVVHHTATLRDQTTVEAVNRFHRDKDWGGGARCHMSRLGWYTQYHHFIEADGKVTHCAEDNEVRWHAGAYANVRSIAISLAGWFDPGHDQGPTDEQFGKLGDLIRHYMDAYNIPLKNVVGHRYFMNKTCPGQLLNDTLIRSLADISDDTVRIDMAFALRFAGQLILDVDDRGALWYVAPNGYRAKIGNKPEEVERFLQNLRDGKIPHTGMKHDDLLKIPVAG